MLGTLFMFVLVAMFLAGFVMTHTAQRAFFEDTGTWLGRGRGTAAERKVYEADLRASRHGHRYAWGARLLVLPIVLFFAVAILGVARGRPLF
jgi:hypothetical protein